MPRIDPIQLLECLSVLLAPNGGIKSADKVMRLASLMTKFSKKLVSKCIYIQILKCTETELLGTFMGSGGWKLVYMWLTESIVSKNWPLVAELLELLLLCPIDIERLKTNNCPKLVKELSKDGNHIGIRALASKLVEQWLKTVKGENVVPLQISDIPKVIADAEASGIFSEPSADLSSTKTNTPVTEKENVENIKPENSSEEKEAIPKLKIKINESKSTSSDTEKTSDKKSKDKSRGDDKSSSKKSSSSKHSSKSRDSSSSDKHRSSSSHKNSSSHSSSSSKDKSRSSSHSSSKSSKNHESSKKSDSTSSSKSSKEHKKEDKIKDERNGKEDLPTDKNSKKDDSPSIKKLGKIPKLKDTSKDKPSMSIEVRKPDEPKPKTVKTFNSKFRSHGLEEEVKPPPSRAALLSKKPPPPLIPPTVVIPKRPSLTLNDTPPEKKIKTVEHVEKPGAIKLIAPKPKPVLLLESDMFMDALNASATNKKEPKKRKRRTSGSKDGNPASDSSPPNTPTASSSPTSENKSKSVPARFYKDTLESEDDRDKSFDKDSDTIENIDANESLIKSPTINSPDIEEPTGPHTLTINGLKGVLCYNKRKGPKKSIRWKPDCDLEEIQYFELDETERVNVTKTFTDMKHLERINEREAFQKARNLSNDDIMEEKTPWRPLILIDAENQVVVEYGKKSNEKEIQAARQKGTLPPLYFHKSMIPDSPIEAEHEPHPYKEPTIIPLEDVTGNQDNVSDFRNVPWPEPKGNAPSNNGAMVVPPMFQPNMVSFPNNFGPPLTGFQGNMIPPADWQGAVMMQNGISASNVLQGQIPPGAMPPMGMPPVAMPPGMMLNPETILMNPEMFGPNPMFPGPPDGFNMMEQMPTNANMFPPDFNNMAGMQGPPSSGNYRGNNRGRGNHWRSKNPNTWDGPTRGRGGGHNRGGRKTVCIYFQRKGSCRQGDNCTFLHPGVNCPY